MDDLVRQAMQKWPQVPDCFGWLGLDARGQWFMRDAQTQSLGTFVQSKGAVLQHEKLIAFIERNYECDDTGRWYFQNGPQRVFVELENTPWIWRIEPQGQVMSHTGTLAILKEAWLDEHGHLYFVTDSGVGLVHTQDVQRAVQYYENIIVNAQSVTWSQVASLAHFVRSPHALSTALMR